MARRLMEMVIDSMINATEIPIKENIGLGLRYMLYRIVEVPEKIFPLF